MMCVHCHFQKYIRGSKRVLNAHGRHGGPKKLIGDHVQVFPNVLHQAITSILAQGKKEIKSNTFQCWIRTAGQWQLVTDATTSYGLRFGRSSTSWKTYEIYFQKDPASCPYLLGVGCSHRFTTETFSVHGAVSPDFGLMGRVSSGAQ